MTLVLPASVANNHSPEWAALHLAIGLYVSRETTLGQAAEVAKVSQVEFQKELGKREIPINYTIDDLDADLKTVEELSGR